MKVSPYPEFMSSRTLDFGILYSICDLGYLTREQALPVSRQLLQGGSKILQLRAKGHDPSTLIDLASSLCRLCHEYDATFIVNDHPQLAKDSHAHGLHLGQDDGSLLEAKKFLGEDLVYGRSTHSPAQAQAALAEGFDYLGFGPLFPTPTKSGRPGIGLENIRKTQNDIGKKIPIFCIGGIKPSNLTEVKNAGAQRVVIVSHLLSAADPESETRSIIAQLA